MIVPRRNAPRALGLVEVPSIPPRFAWSEQQTRLIVIAAAAAAAVAYLVTRGKRKGGARVR